MCMELYLNNDVSIFYLIFHLNVIHHAREGFFCWMFWCPKIKQDKMESNRKSGEKNEIFWLLLTNWNIMNELV